MKFFIGQAVTGEDVNVLRKKSLEIVEALKKSGHDSYCTLCEDESVKKSDGDWLAHAFAEIENCDGFFGVVRSEKRSEGMLMEVGYSLARKKKLIIAVNKTVRDKTYLDDVADVVLEFGDHEDLLNKIREMNLE